MMQAKRCIGAHPYLSAELLTLNKQGAYVGKQIPADGEQRLVLLGSELQPLLQHDRSQIRDC
jgi:hypothetical protein